MATGVNVKLGVSGISQFKADIREAKDSIKTLDAQLALTEKQFKATGDKEEYLKTAKISALGILILGFVGFAVMWIMTYLPTYF